MCGIFALLNFWKYHHDKVEIYNLFLKGRKRGPENTQLVEVTMGDIKSYLGFHRLAINGYNDETSNQPFNIDDVYLICNGEIYNYKQLYKILNIKPKSKSDCEVIIHMYKKYGIEQTLQMLDGVFAFILLDMQKQQVFVARDTYGVRPLYVNTLVHTGKNKAQLESYAFASEIKCLDFQDVGQRIKQFEPGCLSIFNCNDILGLTYVNTIPFSTPNSFCNISQNLEYIDVLQNIFTNIENAVIKRVDNTDREIACLLSGGLDSSIVCALVKKHYKGNLHTWSIGFEGSEDLKYAQEVAKHIGSIHHPIEVNEQEFLDNIPNVIEAIESYDTTTVRASVGNWLICKYIKENSDAKVIFNGDGADEVMGGYLYFHAAPDCIEFDKDCRKLLSHIHFFDVLRSDRSISSHGLEARTPFLDRKFVQYYLSINPLLRHHSSCNKPEKYLMREAIEKFGNSLLPHSVLHRTKEAFSDGVSKQTKSWFETIQEYVQNHIYPHLKSISNEEFMDKFNPYTYNKPKTLEQLYYRDIFDTKFKCSSAAKTLPYFWMPNFVDATDASARTLNIYKKKIKK